MSHIIKYNFFHTTISLAYRVFVGIPTICSGYLKDREALSVESSNLVVRNLKKKSIHIFEEPISPQAVLALLRDFEQLKSKYSLDHNGQLTGRIYAQGTLSTLLDNYAKNLQSYVKDFFNTSDIKVEISYYQESYPSKSIQDIPGGEYHVDDNKANLKYFIYLSDVDLSGGPFSCVPETGTWRLKNSLWRGLLWELTRSRQYLYGSMIDASLYTQREIAIEGCAGTHFLVDTTALHRAQPVLNGCRKVVVISFNRKILFERPPKQQEVYQ